MINFLVFGRILQQATSVQLRVAVICAAILGIIVSLRWLDMPIALYCLRFVRSLNQVGDHLGSAVLVTGEVMVAASLAVYRIAIGRLPQFGRLVIIGCAASLAAFAFNEVVLKMIFGMPNPIDSVQYGAAHQFNYFKGNWDSSFPSGHMTLAAAFTGSFYRYRRPIFWLLVLGTTLAATLLILGDWHFLSDVIAGTLIGALAGTLTAELWSKHYIPRADQQVH